MLLRRLVVFLNLLIGLVFSLFEAPASGKDEDDKAIDAYQIFAEKWQEFEKKRHLEFTNSMNSKSKEIEKIAGKSRDEFIKKQIKNLTSIIDSYQKVTENSPQNILAQYNLVVAHTQLGDLQREINPEISRQSYIHSLRLADILLLTPVTKDSQPILSQTLYISALTHEKLNDKEAAINSLTMLSKRYEKDHFSIYALMSLGDISYSSGKFGVARDFYEEAASSAENLRTANTVSIIPKILYRLAWASYKSGSSESTLDALVKLWKDFHWGQGILDPSSVSEDAIFLLSNTLFSKNSNQFTARSLATNLPINPSVIARLMAMQSSSGSHDKAIFSGEAFLKISSLSKETPHILNYMGISHQMMGNIPASEEYFEKLALMLPAKSLWRTQFSSNLEQISQMEKLAEAAALRLATSSYSNGLVSGNPKAFQKAEAMYKLLINSLPTDSRSPDWKLKIAHCNFFVKKFDAAFSKYNDTIQDSELSDDQLKLALYQSVIAAENAWRLLFSQLISNSQDPQESDEIDQLGNRLEDSVNHYVERFPQDSRSVDLLLVAASIRRDIDHLEKAQKLWERVLVLEASASQRALAIRGILYAKIKRSSPREIIESAFGFLKLERWNSMDRGLYIELNATLSTALLSEADRLKAEGLVAEAGKILTEVANVSPDLPDREKILRDGAYFFAIAGQWLQAEQASKKYLQSENKKFRGDMQYLLARATEYQLKVGEAAQAYFTLAKNYREHPKSNISLERAKSLADAESLDDLNFNISNLKFERAESNIQKIRSLDEMIEILLKKSEFNAAEKLARSRLRLSENTAEKYRSRYKLAIISYLTESKQEGLDELKILDRQVVENRSKLKDDQFRKLIGEINIFRAKHYQNAMQEINLGTSQDTQKSINQKAALFGLASQYYERVISQSEGSLIAQARYEMASTAESLADQIAGIYIRSESTTKLIARTRNKETIQRLHNLAQSQYAKNVLDSRENRTSTEKNQWVLLSQARLNNNPNQSGASEYRDISPIASYGGVISQWDTSIAR